MWRYDAGRRGASPEELPKTLHLHWVLELPPPDPAWPTNQEKLQFDRLYEPVLMGGTLFVPSMISDKLTAYDSDTGAERWKFFAEGPIRFAAVASQGRVYFASDDGHLYCLNAVDGSLQWKFRGGPRDRKLLGNDRLISAWPARGGPVLLDDSIYFGASIWPFMGVFLHSLDAASGQVLWTNSGTGSTYLVQQHNSPAFAGVAPQGYLAAAGDKLVVAGGRTIPATFDRKSGELLHFNVSSRVMGSKGGGGYEAIVGDDFYLNRGCMYRLDNGAFVGNVDAMIVSPFSIIGKDADGIKGFKTGWETLETKDARGNPVKKTVVPASWTTPLDAEIKQVFVKSGSRLYCTAADSAVIAVDLPQLDRGAGVGWRMQLPDEPLNMITGDGKLFVSTAQGRIYCFGGEDRGVPLPASREVAAEKSRVDLDFGVVDEWTQLAGQILRRTSTGAGYCVALGVGSGRLVEELLRQSELHVIVVEPDAARVDAFRRSMDQRRAYGRRVAAVIGEPLGAELPRYMAELVVSEDKDAAGFADDPKFIERVFDVLRPFSGSAAFVCSQAEYDDLRQRVAGAKLDQGRVTRSGRLAVIERFDAPSGSGDWTHQYGNAANTVTSIDARVRTPLGLLWFGGPSNAAVLPRHGHGPTPQVSGGRLYIEGRDMIRAMDIYTGRVAWERELQGVGKHYDYTSHEPGANLIGSNYVSMSDGVYVVHDDRCLRLDPVTGETIATFELPASGSASSVSGDSSAEAPKPARPAWGYIGIDGDVLIGGAQPTSDQTPEYHDRELRRMRGGVAETLKIFKSLRGFRFLAPIKDDAPHEQASRFIGDHVNLLLLDDDMVARIPLKARFRAEGAEEVEKKLKEYLEAVPGRTATDHEALVLKRELLHLYFGWPKYVPATAGKFGSTLRAQSKKLVAMNRYSGRILWEHEAKHQIRHNSITVGGGTVFYIDRLSKSRESHFRRRGLPIPSNPSVTALALATGDVVWRADERVFGTWLGYSEEHDVLLQAGSRASDRATDEIGKGMVVYRGSTGDVLWQNELDYSGPCLLLGDRVITQGYRQPGFSLSILTGEMEKRSHPLSGVDTTWMYTRNYGCNTAIGAPNLLTFRSAAAGYYDLAGDSGTGNFGGFRAGCTSNLIPAGGILNAPDYTRTCTCSYQNQASLALVHMPEVETWTFSPYLDDGEAVRRVGLNFGAPGDRLSEGGTRWLDFPSVGGNSPDLDAAVISGEATKYVRHHPTYITGGDLPWVAASAWRGEGQLLVRLAPLRVQSIPNEITGGAPLAVSDALVSVQVPPVAAASSRPQERSLQAKAKAKTMAVIAPDSSLATSSITVELWVRVDGDVTFVDASGEADGIAQGFILDQRKLRARYVVANEAGDQSEEDVVIVESGDTIARATWAHVAFSYDSKTGVGTLLIDGKVVGTHDGPDNRSLWWGSEPPAFKIGHGGASTGTHLDELRICRAALGAEELRVRTEAEIDAAKVIGEWRMRPETTDTPARRYTARLVFAELEDRQPGERRFDVLLQGSKRLDGFDIAREAGAVRQSVVKEFRGIEVTDSLSVILRAADGSNAQPLLCGLELVEEEVTASGD